MFGRYRPAEGGPIICSQVLVRYYAVPSSLCHQTKIARFMGDRQPASPPISGGRPGRRDIGLPLEETAEVATWSQLGLHRKPVVLLDVAGFWQPLVDQLDQMVSVGLLKPANREIIQRTGTADAALNLLASTELVYPEKWISDEDR